MLVTQIDEKPDNYNYIQVIYLRFRFDVKYVLAEISFASPR